MDAKDVANAWSRDPLVLLQSGVHRRYTESSANNSFIFNKKNWCPGWKSYPVYALETSKLFILRNARNAKNAKNTTFGYVVATRKV
jgi:hypothetical protein